MSYSPAKGEITKYTVNGDNMLDSFTKEERNFKFSEKTTTTDGTPDSEDRAKETYSFGSISLQLGVRVNLK